MKSFSVEMGRISCLLLLACVFAIVVTSSAPQSNQHFENRLAITTGPKRRLVFVDCIEFLKSDDLPELRERMKSMEMNSLNFQVLLNNPSCLELFRTRVRALGHEHVKRILSPWSDGSCAKEHIRQLFEADCITWIQAWYEFEEMELMPLLHIPIQDFAAWPNLHPRILVRMLDQEITNMLNLPSPLGDWKRGMKRLLQHSYFTSSEDSYWAIFNPNVMAAISQTDPENLILLAHLYELVLPSNRDVYWQLLWIIRTEFFLKLTEFKRDKVDEITSIIKDARIRFLTQINPSKNRCAEILLKMDPSLFDSLPRGYLKDERISPYDLSINTIVATARGANCCGKLYSVLLNEYVLLIPVLKSEVKGMSMVLENITEMVMESLIDFVSKANIDDFILTDSESAPPMMPLSWCNRMNKVERKLGKMCFEYFYEIFEHFADDLNSWYHIQVSYFEYFHDIVQESTDNSLTRCSSRILKNARIRFQTNIRFSKRDGFDISESILAFEKSFGKLLPKTLHFKGLPKNIDKDGATRSWLSEMLQLCLREELIQPSQDDPNLFIFNMMIDHKMGRIMGLIFSKALEQNMTLPFKMPVKFYNLIHEPSIQKILLFFHNFYSRNIADLMDGIMKDSHEVLRCPDRLQFTNFRDRDNLFDPYSDGDNFNHDGELSYVNLFSELLAKIEEEYIRFVQFFSGSFRALYNGHKYDVMIEFGLAEKLNYEPLIISELLPVIKMINGDIQLYHPVFGKMIQVDILFCHFISSLKDWQLVKLLRHWNGSELLDFSSSFEILTVQFLSITLNTAAIISTAPRSETGETDSGDGDEMWKTNLPDLYLNSSESFSSSEDIKDEGDLLKNLLDENEVNRILQSMHNMELEYYGWPDPPCVKYVDEAMDYYTGDVKCDWGGKMLVPIQGYYEIIISLLALINSTH